MPAHSASFISWRGLEAAQPFEQLPALHRRFLIWRGVAQASELGVRRAQQRTEAELNRMVQEGLAQRDGEDWLIDAQALSGFQLPAPVGSGDALIGQS